MKLKPEQYLAISQLVLGACILLCLAIIPHYFFSFDQGGVSNYGTKLATVAPYSLGFGVAALGTLMASFSLPANVPRRTVMRFGLLGLSLLYGLALVSTFQYKLNASHRHLHEQLAVALFLGMLLGALWLRFVALKEDVSIRRAFILFAVGFLAAVLTFFGPLHMLFSSQITCGASFGYMLTHGVKTLTTNLTPAAMP
ncbi:MAG TPA: hypothetical protein VLG37_00690 [Candidatus Saccharimonadales bacterium]|nr:hypothetical protein [Candidatus Saccharimonadales bacterium]